MFIEQFQDFMIKIKRENSILKFPCIFFHLQWYFFTTRFYNLISMSVLYGGFKFCTKIYILSISVIPTQTVQCVVRIWSRNWVVQEFLVPVRTLQENKSLVTFFLQNIGLFLECAFVLLLGVENRSGSILEYICSYPKLFSWFCYLLYSD